MNTIYNEIMTMQFSDLCIAYLFSIFRIFKCTPKSIEVKTLQNGNIRFIVSTLSTKEHGQQREGMSSFIIHTNLADKVLSEIITIYPKTKLLYTKEDDDI